MRNAFGNLRDILKEVSYSGMMASYLTYQNSQSLAAPRPPLTAHRSPLTAHHATHYSLLAARCSLLAARCYSLISRRSHAHREY